MPPPVPPILLPVPNAPGPGPWVDCSLLGPDPEAQLDAAATVDDACDLETAAFAGAVLGNFIAEFAGQQTSLTLVTRETGSIAFARAVRLQSVTGGPLTPGLNLNLASSNVSQVGPQGPAGPAGGAPVDATLQTDGIGGILAMAGAVGIAAVVIVMVNGVNQVRVTFLSAFANGNYPVQANWWALLDPAEPLRPIGFNTGVAPWDGRIGASVTFELFTLAGVPVDPAINQVRIMITCG